MTGRIDAVVARRLAGISRAAAGLIPPVSISRNVDAARGGVALHHGGDNVPITSHLDCLATWRAWQRYHMGPRYSPPAPGHGWVDLAYTLGACQHGYTLAGRGAGIRTAANGTNDGNLRFYAIVWIGGARQTPTQAALDAIAWGILELRRLGAGTRVVGHRDLSATSCPHPTLLALARRLDRQQIPTSGDEMPIDNADLAKIRATIVDVLGGDRINWTPNGQEDPRGGNQGIINAVWWANTRAAGGRGTVLEVLTRTVDTSAAILAAVEGLPGVDLSVLASKIAAELEVDLDGLADRIGHPPTAREIVDEHARLLARAAELDG